MVIATFLVQERELGFWSLYKGYQSDILPFYQISFQEKKNRSMASDFFLVHHKLTCLVWERKFLHLQFVGELSLYVSILGGDQLRNARGWNGTIWSMAPIPKKLLVGQFSWVLPGLLGSCFSATGILGSEVHTETKQRPCPISQKGY